MKQKLLCLLLALTMVLGLPVHVRALEDEAVSWTLNDGLLTISGQGPMADYAEGEAPWLGQEVYSLIIEDGVTSIGSNAFRGMEMLQDALIGRGVAAIDKTAFNDCPELGEVIFLGDDHIIPAGTFQNCPGLSVFRFAGDQPALEAGSLNSGNDSLSVYYDRNNDTWSDKKDIQFDPVDPIQYSPYDNYITESGTCGDHLTWQIVRTNISYHYNYLVISGTGPMYDYAEGEAPWLPYIKNVGALYILPGASTIGENAFAGVGLSLASAPGSIREIGAGAFQKNPSLTYFPLMNNIRSVGDYAFAYTDITRMNFGTRLPELGIGLYQGCTGMVWAHLPEGLTHIPDAMFSGCSRLMETTIPTSVTSIGTDAFFACSRLKTVNYYGTTQQWDAIEVADGNDPLLDAELKGVLTTSGTCGDDAVWELSEDFTTLTISGTGDVTSRPWQNAGGLVERIIVGEGITSLCSDAFYEFTVVTEILLPETLTRIGDNCFRNNYALTDLVLPAGLTNLGKNAFTWCTSLPSMVIPEGITEIPEELFARCSSLVSVELPEGLTSIGAGAFSVCESLSEINIPAGLTALGGDAFLGCKSLSEFAWPEAITFIGTALQGTGIVELEIPETVTGIGAHAFLGCTRLESITIPDSVTSIGERAFESTLSLKSVSIPESITVIPFSCFNGSGLTELVLPESITTIEKYAFHSCASLERVHLPESLTDIASEVFSYCASLAEINWPSGVDTIGWHQFNGTALVEFTVPATVKTVESYAFYNCSKLEKLVFESRDTQIEGGQVFDNTPLLTIYCWNDSDVQAAAEFAMIPYVLFDPPADRPLYPIYGIIACGDGQIIADPAESVGYQWVNIDFVPGPDSVLVGLELYYYSDVELELRVEEVDEDTLRLLMPNCPVEFVAYFQNTLTGFIDIKSTDFFYDPVIWAFQNGITTGVSELEFGPNADCNRAQVVTFLWRAAGSPEPAGTENPFVDVEAGSFYEKAVLWAVENGITNGADATHFNPGGACNRAQVVTFLYRAFGNPTVEGAENPFSDVPADTWYTAPVLWAVENGITNGMGGDLFGVDNPCNRAQIVTFLYRAYTK